MASFYQYLHKYCQYDVICPIFGYNKTFIWTSPHPILHLFCLGDEYWSRPAASTNIISPRNSNIFSAATFPTKIYKISENKGKQCFSIVAADTNRFGGNLGGNCRLPPGILRTVLSPRQNKCNIGLRIVNNCIISTSEKLVTYSTDL